MLGCGWVVAVASMCLSIGEGVSNMAVGVSDLLGAAAGVSVLSTGGSSGAAAGVFGLLMEGCTDAGVSGLLTGGSPGVSGLSAESSRLTDMSTALPPKTLSNNAK